MNLDFRYVSMWAHLVHTLRKRAARECSFLPIFRYILRSLTLIAIVVVVVVMCLLSAYVVEPALQFLSLIAIILCVFCFFRCLCCVYLHAYF